MAVVSDVSQALPFQVRVMDGPLSVADLQPGQPPGVVQLSGRTGPYRPISYEQEMRVKTTMYPGNPEGTQQIIGKKFNDTTISGMWKDRYIGDGQARAFVDLFEQIQDAGPSVEVTWGAGIDDLSTSVVTQPWVRVGVLRTFKSSPERPQDIGWEMTFEWRGRGQGVTPAVTSTAMVNPREGVRQLVDDLQFTSDSAESYRDGLLFGLQQASDVSLNQAITDIESATDKVEAVTSVIVTTTNFPANAARAVLGAANLALDAVSNLEGVMLSLSPMSVLLPTDLATELLKTIDRIFDVLGAAATARDSARATIDGVGDQALPDIIAEVVAPAGVDLRDLALRFYGSADAWWAIADANNLTTSVVPAPPTGPTDAPARPLRIPRLQAGPQGDLRQNC